MALGVVGSVYYVFFTEEDWKWKALAAGTMVLSLLLQFVPALRVHFSIPLILQTLVAVWMVVYWKLDR
jgi:ABC-type siderophore export system fused ATPase/permease subunit